MKALVKIELDVSNPPTAAELTSVLRDALHTLWPEGVELHTYTVAECAHPRCHVAPRLDDIRCAAHAQPFPSWPDRPRPT